MIDSHCHFDFAEFDQNRAAIWQHCQALNIKQLIIPGTEPQQWQRAAQIAQQFDGMYSACGLHPYFINNSNQQNLQQTMLDFIQANPQIIAIGECGLDKHIPVDEATQQQVFTTQVQLAIELELPLIIHVRDQHNSLLRLLKQLKPKQGGVIHGFAGSFELAQSYWQLGFYLGIGGVISYPRAQKTRKAVQQMPLESLLLETDAPDMPLCGQSAKSNTPENIIAIAQCLAELKGLSLDAIEQQTTLNAQRLFFSHAL